MTKYYFIAVFIVFLSLHITAYAAKDIYLQVEASSNDSSFETLSPRQRISSAL